MPTLYPNTTLIYGLCDPSTGQLRYIGKADNPARRLQNHLSESTRKRFCHRHKWIASLADNGLSPELFEIERCAVSEWPETERFWIAYFRSIGCDLVNGSDGGEGNKNCKLSDITRNRMSQAHEGTRQSPEHRAACAKSRIVGLKRTPEQCARMSESQRNSTYVKSAETRAKMSVSLSGEGNPFFGKKHTDESKAKISAVKTGVPSGLKGIPHDKAHWSHLLKTYILTSPDGEEFTVSNLPLFCKERGLNRCNLLGVLAGRFKRSQKWAIRRPDETPHPVSLPSQSLAFDFD